MEKITYKQGFWILFIISLIGICAIGFQGVGYKLAYEVALEKGAEDVVTAIEMLVVCQELGNVTIEDIADKYIEDYVEKTFGE